VAPFATVALLAEASLALPPGPQSGSAVLASIVALLAVAGAFLLPWSRLPVWLPVLVPLLYTGSVLALILAAGATSGVGAVILIPLIWTALFNHRWESACVVAAIVAVEVVISLTPVAVGNDVIARRVLLWTSLGALISIAAHGLRDRIRRSQAERERLQDQLRERSLIEDRDRIAADLKDKVIQQIFAAGLTLQGATALTSEPEVRRRVGASIRDLDHAIRMLRDTIFGLEHRVHRRKLRQEVLDLCRDLSPAPEISFTGPVDGALHPSTRAQLLDTLREALGLIGHQAVLSRIGIPWTTAPVSP
jgi:signal transduction histidine kinase